MRLRGAAEPDVLPRLRRAAGQETGEGKRLEPAGGEAEGRLARKCISGPAAAEADRRWAPRSLKSWRLEENLNARVHRREAAEGGVSVRRRGPGGAQEGFRWVNL